MNSRSMESISPTETLEINNGRSLFPRIKLQLKIDPTNPSSLLAKPIDEWQLKLALINFLKTSFSIPIPIPEEDLYLKRFKDIKKQKRCDPIAHITLFIRGLRFIVNGDGKKYVNLAETGNNDVSVEVLEKKFLERRRLIVDKMDGVDLNHSFFHRFNLNHSLCLRSILLYRWFKNSEYRVIDP